MNHNTLIFEACVGNFKQAKDAELRGASRIELCENLSEGGTTPSFGTIKLTRQLLNIPVFSIIRPRGGDFVYSNEEIEIMIEDIIQCKNLGLKGVVFGVLNKDNLIDTEKMKKLIECAKGLQITFHMAFDSIINKFEAIDILVNLGVNRILTKGGKSSAIEGKEILKELVIYSNGRIIILPGGGITKENYRMLYDYLGIKEFHGTKIV